MDCWTLEAIRWRYRSESHSVLNRHPLLPGQMQWPSICLPVSSSFLLQSTFYRVTKSSNIWSMLISLSCLKPPSDSPLQVLSADHSAGHIHPAYCDVAPAEPSNFIHTQASPLLSNYGVLNSHACSSWGVCVWVFCPKCLSPASAVPEQLHLVLQVPAWSISPLWNSPWPCFHLPKLAFFPLCFSRHACPSLQNHLECSGAGGWDCQPVGNTYMVGKLFFFKCLTLSSLFCFCLLLSLKHILPLHTNTRLPELFFLELIS